MISIISECHASRKCPSPFLRCYFLFASWPRDFNHWRAEMLNMIFWNSETSSSDIVSLRTDVAPLLGGVKDVIREPQQIKQKPHPSLPLYLIASNPIGQTHKWDDDIWWLYFETRALMLCLQEGKKTFTIWQFGYNDAGFLCTRRSVRTVLCLFSFFAFLCELPPHNSITPLTFYTY